MPVLRNLHPLRTRLVHPGTLLALAFGLAACDVEDAADLPDDDIDESIDADASPAHAADASLTAPPRPSAVLPVLTIAAPIRAEDLPKNHYLQINVDADGGIFHDMIIARYDEASGDWTAAQDGAADERDALGWDIPIYSGVAGEVISCWRNAPYDAAYQPALEQIGGNFMIIRTADDKYVFYAHMQTDAIPAELCPNESASGWYADVTQKRSGSNIPLESYVEPAERAQIAVGQYIGRMGAHGNAAGVHVHIHAGNVSTNGAGVVSTGSPAYELDFSDVWYHAADNTQPPQSVAWTFAAPGDIPALAHTTKLRIWPSYKHEATFADPPRLDEFDQFSGGLEDPLCHNISSGGLWLDYANVSQLGGTDWSGSGLDFCSSPDQRLHKGDFDGNGLTDLLCHDIVGGERWVRYVTNAGDFDGATTYSDTGAWCNAEQQVLHVGDFDGDGRDDLLCHDKLDGERRVDLSSPYSATHQTQMPFAGTDVMLPNAWCNDHYQRLHVGDFDGDGRVDLLCHDVRAGKLWLDYSSGTTLFNVTDFSLTTANFCNQGGEHMLIGEFTGDTRDDLLCHDADDGDLEIRAAQTGSTRFLTTATWKRDDSNWCTGLRQRLRAGDVGGDVRDDLLCHDEKTGSRTADFMTAITGLTTGGFQGVDFTSSGGWCGSNTQGLH